MRKFFAGIMLAAVMVVGGISVTACSSQAQPPVPASWVVPWTNPVTGVTTTYCPYQYTPYETQGYGYTGQCTPIAYPSISMVPQTYGSLPWTLMNYWTMYSDFYMSDYWFYHYYAPLGARYHVTLISYSSYMSNVGTFHTTYASQIRTNSVKATYLGKSGRTTGSYKFPTTNSGDAAKIWSNNTGANRTGTGSVGKAGGGGGVRPPAPRAPAIHVGHAGR